jgi:hypothetical protein
MNSENTSNKLQNETDYKKEIYEIKRRDSKMEARGRKQKASLL